VTGPASADVRGLFKVYRVMAFVVGTLTVVVILVAWPLKELAHNDTLRPVVMVHGFLFMGYVAVVFLLGARLGWRWLTLGLRMAAGFVPFATFIVERQVAAEVKLLLVGE